MVQYQPYSTGNPHDVHAVHRLAPHETLELHELAAMKSAGLIQLKKAYPTVTDPELKQLVLQTIRSTEQHLSEIVQILQTARYDTF